MSTPEKTYQKVMPLSGFPKYLPAGHIVEQHLLDVIRTTVERHGFASLETRSVEPVERLTHQGEDADKEIYAVSRLAGGAEESREARLGLHFDLTVPFARYVLENSGRLTFPLRRYQIQKAWRGERPQEGRYREFTQADLDVVDVGDLPFHYEVEIPLVVAEIFAQLPIGAFRIQVNNRKVADGFYRGLGLHDVVGTLRIVDKLDKVGADGVRAMLLASGATAEQADAFVALAGISGGLEVVDRVRRLAEDRAVEHPALDEGLAALSAILTTAQEHSPGILVADFRIARGLDYTRAGYRDPARRVRVVRRGVFRRALRRAGLRRAHHLPRRGYVDRRVPADGAPVGPGRDRDQVHADLRARGAGRRGGPERGDRGSPPRCARGESRQRWRRRRHATASRYPLRRPARHPVRLVRRCGRGGRRPGQGHSQR